jgi:hypothetical protein
MSAHANPDIIDDGLVFLYDTDDGKSYKGEPVVNIWSVAQGGGSVNNRTSWDRPNAYNGDITDSVYTGGTWNGNRIWEVLHTEGTTGYGGYESWRLCVSQPTAGSYSSTRRVAIKICILEGSISDLALHTGGGNSSHNSSYFTAIPESQVPTDCPIKSGWYQFLAPANWTSTTVSHCVGLGFITYNRVKILTAEPMYYPSDHLIPFSGTERSATQGLIDRTGNTTIDISNASFDSNAQMAFDGTDDYFEISDPNVSSLDGFSVELIIKPDNPTSSPAVIVPNSGGIDHWLRFDGNGRLYIRMIPAANSGGQNFRTSTQLSSGNYHHVVFTFKQSEGGKAYYNGALETSAAATLTALDWSSIWRIGQRGNNTMFFEGELPVLKVYNRTLTAAEVLQNFNATKSRFDL